MLSIVLTGGGTAGHVIPCLTLLPELSKKFSTISYIGSNDGPEKDLAKKHGLPFYGITCTKLRRKLTAKNLLIPVKLQKGIAESKKILKKLNPDVVFSKGGYVALPVVIACKNLKIPVISHESDLTAGLANKIASKYSALTLTSFRETAKQFKNGLYTGSPIKKRTGYYDKALIKKEWGFSTKPVLLAFGGSLGSVALNNALTATLDDLLKDYDVLHLTGKKNFNNPPPKRGYKALAYLDDMQKAYAICDVVVSRCGANSAFEVLSLGKPCVFIPLPKAESRGDQIENAEYFFKQGYALMLKEETLTPQSLKFTIDCAYKNRRTDKPLIADGTEEIVKILFSTATSRNKMKSL